MIYVCMFSQGFHATKLHIYYVFPPSILSLGGGGRDHSEVFFSGVSTEEISISRFPEKENKVSMCA